MTTTNTPRTTEQKIAEYYHLKQSRDRIDRRLSVLKEQLMPFLYENSKAIDETTYTATTDKYVAQLKVKDLSKLDQAAAVDLIESKHLHWCLDVVANPSKLEQAYIDGQITDDELRNLRLPKYAFALRVEAI